MPADLNSAAIAREFQAYNQAKLEAIIRRANEQYWQENAADLPDTLYDQLVERLRAIAPEAELLEDLGTRAPEGDHSLAELLSKTPAERIGWSVPHSRPMLSLAKCYAADELDKWADKFEGDVLAMPKMDGVACSLRYDTKGKLEVAATRGSGSVGEDITVNVLAIPGVPKALKLSKSEGAIEVRGELYMRQSTFAKRYAEDFSHPRNLTAGAIKQKESDHKVHRDLAFYAYDVDGLELATESQKMQRLTKLGFDHPEHRIIEREHMATVVDDLTKRRRQLDFEIDGIVFRAARTDEFQRLGETGHHPRATIAYKFASARGMTTLEDVLWSVSRTGTITPVAFFAGVEVDGATLSRASLHNVNRFEELKLSPGSQIEISRRGGVIPMVERVVEPSPTAEPFELPENCPACSGPVERRKKRDGEFLYCARPEDCISARLRELEHFAKVLDIQGFGPKVIAQAVEQGLLTQVSDFYRLDIDALASLERLGRKSAENLVNEVANKKTLPLAVFLQALGIDHLGKRNSELLVRNFATLDEILALGVEQLTEIKGIKKAIAEALVQGLQNRAAIIESLRQVINVEVAPEVEPETASAANGVLAGKSFLFTGTLTSGSRKDAETRVKALGGTIASGVSAKLDYLVLGESKGKVSSKQKKAEKLRDEGKNIEILDETGFEDLLATV